MADETWGTMNQELESLKMQINISQAVVNAGPLKDLCLATIVDQFQFFCKTADDPQESLDFFLKDHIDGLYQDYRQGKFNFSELVRNFDIFLIERQDPFKDLPSSVMLSVQSALQFKRPSPLVLPYLISQNSEKVQAELYGAGWNERNREAVMRRIRDKGQNILDLSLSGFGNPDTMNVELLREMLRRLTKLTKLCLASEQIDDSVLAAIGSSCPELRYLSLTSDNVTDEGLRYLCDTDLPRGPNSEKYGQCKKLTSLDMYSCSEISEDGVALVLTNLPDIVSLIVNDIAYVAVILISESSPSLQLKLQNLTVHHDVREDDLQYLESVVSRVPDVKELTLESKDLENIDAFLKLQHVTSLKFMFLNILPPSQLELLTCNFGNQLTHLKIYCYDEKVDISVIGYNCMCLTNLKWGTNCTEDSKYKLVPLVHFSKLKKVKIESDEDNGFTIPGAAVKCILASPNLVDFSIRYYEVSDYLFKCIIDLARTCDEVFSNLENLTILCDISSLRAKQIICLSPKLKDFLVPNDIGPICKEFVQQYNLTHCKIVYLLMED